MCRSLQSSATLPRMGVQERTEMKRHRRHNLKERFEILKTLGQGTYGKVKLSVEKESGIQVILLYG